MSDDPCRVPDPAEPVDLVDVCRHILRIVARLDSSFYTDPTLRQTEVVEHPDPADPASDITTAQGWDAF